MEESDQVPSNLLDHAGQLESVQPADRDRAHAEVHSHPLPRLPAHSLVFSPPGLLQGDRIERLTRRRTLAECAASP